MILKSRLFSNVENEKVPQGNKAQQLGSLGKISVDTHCIDGHLVRPSKYIGPQSDNLNLILPFSR